MARGQSDDLLLAMLLLLAGVSSEGCHPNSRKLHICLNIYLERDFPMVETILRGSGPGGSRALLEGPADLQNICGKLLHLQVCYEGLLEECNTYWQLDRYMRLMNTLKATYSHLCGNSTSNIYNIKGVLLSGACVLEANRSLAQCSQLGTGWVYTWKEILRMQVEPADRCTSIGAYQTCFMQVMKGFRCGNETAKAYGQLFEVWLTNWCSNGTARLTASAIIFLTLIHLVLKKIIEDQWRFDNNLLNS